jgi:uncharacterized protein YbjT (DUF2867 family)
MARPVLVTGASGFVGSHLTEALDAQGYSVLAMTRHPDTYSGVGKPIFGDVYEPASLSQALADADSAYYLVHSLSRPDFVEKDAEAALAFGRAAAKAGLERLIYLGGLGRDDANLSAHLKSRREVEHLLARGGVPVTTLRAAIVIGHGSSSPIFQRWWCRSGRRHAHSRLPCPTSFAISSGSLSPRKLKVASSRSEGVMF